MPEQNPGGTFEQAILEAAERLFMEKGFALTSTTEIAKEAGCNQALVHYYFRTKTQLFDSVFEKKARLFFSVILEIDESELPFEEKLKRKIEAHFDMLRDNPRLPFLIINELLTNPRRMNHLKENLSGMVGQAFQPVERELAAEIKKGNIRPMPLMDLFLTMVSLNAFLFLSRPMFQQAFGLNEEELKQFTGQRRQEHVRIVLASLRP